MTELKNVTVQFGHKTYEVTIADDVTHSTVKVVGGQTLMSGTNNWMRAVRIALKGEDDD